MNYHPDIIPVEQQLAFSRMQRLVNKQAVYAWLAPMGLNTREMHNSVMAQQKSLRQNIREWYTGTELSFDDPERVKDLASAVIELALGMQVHYRVVSLKEEHGPRRKRPGPRPDIFP
eukprot:CAMPEP_0185745200 /NCGR_PEP_ID=MMETSP1174-20130828/3466_1 /TAXON_ID=35687 /ORGANISM="Dictyocha speculum, Strain CCMP1381" /LENGTH=116 /DNA_ID=CAMNT_0028419041 /DNA_START=158 /DNA_END=504 /DNA_ORIENTATION=+